MNGRKDVSVSEFAGLVNANGSRKAYTEASSITSSQFNSNYGPVQSVDVRHRSGSLTQFHMHGDNVGGAYHNSVTTGEQSRLSPSNMGDFKEHVRAVHSKFF